MKRGVLARRSPLVWLASFPRSGNTLLRLVLEESFNLVTHSLYESNNSAPLHLTHLDKFQESRGGDELYLVKTHGLPPKTGDRAIYIVRDARAVLVSFHAYLTDHQEARLTIEELIVGSEWPGDWSNHVMQWLNRQNSDTLLVKYEDLACGDPATLAAISKFLDRPQLRPFNLSFQDLNKDNPKFYRQGSNELAISLVAGEHAALFELFHGETMKQLGYPVESTPCFNLRLKREITTAVSAQNNIEADLLERIEADRAERLRMINALDEQCQLLLLQLVASEADRAERLVIIDRLVEQLAAQRRAVEEERERADAEMTWLNEDRAARHEVMLDLSAQLEQAEADRAARLDLITRLDERCQRLTAQLEASEKDRADRLAVIEELLDKETTSSRRAIS